MSISREIMKAFPADVTVCKAVDVTLNGQKAVQVKAVLTNNKIVEGIFAQEERPSFGGVDFSTRYDVVALMVHKIRSVLDGTAE
jgi:hypothetical protein